MSTTGLQTLLVGGGMISHDQILPSLYQLQRLGKVGEISVCALTGNDLKKLADSPDIKKAFPSQSFRPYPDFNAGIDLNEKHPTLYNEVLENMDEGQLVVMALPDQLHYRCIVDALNAGQNVIAVKPLVLKYSEAIEVEKLALEKGLFVGVEYHKRFDDRVLMARMMYRDGKFGEFRLAQASMVEPFLYRDSNFQNWCTCENTDLFTYVGCHYVDQIHFITGHLPVEVSVYGIVDKYPNGNEGYLWTDGRVLWDNGASMSVMNALGYPNAAAGGNMQGLKMLAQGDNDACLLFHEDQYRGLKYSLNSAGDGPGDTIYTEPSPDYLKMVYRGGEGLIPVGYGYRSVEGLTEAALRVANAGDLAARQQEIKKVDAEGIIATPANSSYNELVVEAARLSVTSGGRAVTISYGDKPGVSYREW